MLPARRLKSKCRHLFALTAVLLILPATTHAQSGSATLQGTVSEFVALSILPNSIQGELNAAVVSSGANTVRITLSGETESPVIRVPLLVRSNSSFRISAVFESQTTKLDQLSVIDGRPTGRLVSTEAVNAVVLPAGDMEVSRALPVLTGPRVSLGGKLDSPNNALQLTLLIRLRPELGRHLLANLTFIATAGPLTQ